MANYSFSTIHAGGPFADGYDSEDRFMRFKRSGVNENVLLTRSDIGNISNVNRNGTNTARGYNTSHGLTTVTGGTTQTYDTDGNTTKLHTNVNAVWDDAGRMKNTNVPAGATAGIQGLNENGYVGGTRIWKKITRSGSVVEHRVHIHAGPNLIAEYNAGVAASTPVQEYVYAGEIDSLVLIRRSDATKYGVTRNRQWSVTALHDLANGNVVERYAYELTGKRTIYAANGTTVRTTSSYGNPFGYTNRWHDDESGLMYFRARYYNPLTGEFLSRDPMEFVDGMSLYRGYMGLVDTDPFGLLKASIEIAGNTSLPKWFWSIETTWFGNSVEWQDVWSKTDGWSTTFVPSWRLGLSLTGWPSRRGSNGVLYFLRDSIGDVLPIEGVQDPLLIENDLWSGANSVITRYKKEGASAREILHGESSAESGDDYCVQCDYIKANIGFAAVEYKLPAQIGAVLDSLAGKGQKEAVAFLVKRYGITADIALKVLQEYLNGGDGQDVFRLRLELVICADNKRFVGAYNLPVANRTGISFGPTTVGPPPKEKRWWWHGLGATVAASPSNGWPGNIPVQSSTYEAED